MKIGEPFNPHLLFTGAWIPNCILECSDLLPIAKLTWARLQQFAGENGSCYPSYAKLARELGISRRHAMNAVRELIDKGFIKTVSPSRMECGKKITNHYVFIWHDCFENAKLRRTGEPQFTSQSRTSKEQSPELVNHSSQIPSESSPTGEPQFTSY